MPTIASPYFDHAIKDGHAKLLGEGRQQKVLYVAVNHTEKYSDPERHVRAEYWAELIYRYGYEPDRIDIEFNVPDRQPDDRADLVIFTDNMRKKPWAVIECKKEGITDAEFAQAIEQACGNGTWQKFRANYVGVVAGNTRRFFDFKGDYSILERDANVIADLPKQYGKPEEYRYYKGSALDIQPVDKEILISAIRKCHQTLWGGGRMSPPMAFGELSKIIFVKISDEKATKRGEPYEFQIKTHEPNRKLAERIRAIYEEQKRRDPEVFTETIKIDDATLRTVVSHLQGINLSKTDLDTKGLAFEQFMDGFFKGDFGQYFTPREIIAFAVEMIPPTHEDLVLDPSCGSGGFLLYALDVVRREASEFYDEEIEQTDHKTHWHTFAQKRLFGIEINEEITRVAKMNMILHDDGHTNVIGTDALDNIAIITDLNRGFKRNHFTRVYTNPPFGAIVKQTEKPYLSEFEMSRLAGKAPIDTEPELDSNKLTDVNAGKRVIKQKTSMKSEILFIERIWHFLKPGGKAAIVLPDGILTNSSLQAVRDWLLERFKLLAVVSLPQFAFAHYGAGVKASVVFVQKREDNEAQADDEVIFMAIAENIGYDATGRKTFKVVRQEFSADKKTRIETHRCDLFDMKVQMELAEVPDKPNQFEWVERHREVIKGTGIVAQFHQLQKDPRPFFA